MSGIRKDAFIHTLWGNTKRLRLIGAVYSIYITLKLAVNNHLFDIQNKQLEQALKIQQKHYLYQKEKNLDLRRFRHDLVNHIGVVKGLLVQKEYAEAANYIDEIWNVTDSLSYKIDCGDDYINAILNYYSYICDKYNISFSLYGKLIRPFEIDAIDVTTILGNALQNAYEATLSTVYRYITIEIIDHEDEVFIAVSNSFKDNNKQAHAFLITSKENKEQHGFGIKNIVSAVEKYNGEYYFTKGKKDNIDYFRLDISIPRSGNGSNRNS